MKAGKTTTEITAALSDHSRKTFPSGTPLSQIIVGLEGHLSPSILAARVNGMSRDLSSPVCEAADIEVLTFDTPEGKEVFRHSSTHIMAQAVKDLFPGVQLGIGPAIEEGFYYDFSHERPFTPEDLEKIEKRMKEIIASDVPFTRQELTKKEAVALFQKRGEGLKVELIKEFEEGEVTVYHQGTFIDLCRGPHVPSTGKITAFKLISSAGAYWRGDENKPMLQRIYGTSFPTREELDSHLQKLEEIKKRDHRKIGKELDLFSLNDEVGAGLVIWHPKGAIVRRVIEDFWRDEHSKAGYQLVYTPHIAKLDLWRRSGHLDFYKDYMYAPMEIEGVNYELKPMNCPFHIMIYKSHLRSYRDLPLRFSELGTVYRFERSGVLHGLMRVRGFTQDDAHIFCRPDQLEVEIARVIDFTLFVLRTFGFTEYSIYLSTRPEKAVGTVDNWEKATAALVSALTHKGLSYQVDPGEGVFYGPKIDIKIKDVLGRAWQCTTIQVDFNLPDCFSLTYMGDDNKEHRPIMVHRALLGSLERFMGILIEQHAGAFPVWLAPVQAIILTITDREKEHARVVCKALEEQGVRVEMDLRNEKIGFKIREAQLAKIPYMLVVGGREREKGTVSVRKRGGEDLGVMEASHVLALIGKEMKEKL